MLLPLLLFCSVVSFSFQEDMISCESKEYIKVPQNRTGECDVAEASLFQCNPDCKWYSLTESSVVTEHTEYALVKFKTKAGSCELMLGNQKCDYCQCSNIACCGISQIQSETSTILKVYDFVAQSHIEISLPKLQSGQQAEEDVYELVEPSQSIRPKQFAKVLTTGMVVTLKSCEDRTGIITGDSDTRCVINLSRGTISAPNEIDGNYTPYIVAFVFLIIVLLGLLLNLCYFHVYLYDENWGKEIKIGQEKVPDDETSQTVAKNKPGNVFSRAIGNALARNTGALQQSNTMQSGTMQSGTLQSGTMQSGTMQSGTMQSGTMQSGTVQSGTMQSGTMQSGTLHSSAMQSGANISNESKTVSGNKSFLLMKPNQSIKQEVSMMYGSDDKCKSKTYFNEANIKLKDDSERSKSSGSLKKTLVGPSLSLSKKKDIDKLFDMVG